MQDSDYCRQFYGIMVLKLIYRFITPLRPAAYVNRANVLRDQGRYGDALEDYGKALLINPRFEKAYANRGYLYQRLEEHSKAIDDLSRAIDIIPGYDKALLARGISYYKLGMKEAACADIRIAAHLGNGQAGQMVQEVCAQ